MARPMVNSHVKRPVLCSWNTGTVTVVCSVGGQLGAKPGRPEGFVVTAWDSAKASAEARWQGGPPGPRFARDEPLPAVIGVVEPLRPRFRSSVPGGEASGLLMTKDGPAAKGVRTNVNGVPVSQLVPDDRVKAWSPRGG